MNFSEVITIVNERVLSGIKASTPIMASYIALGVACGIVLYDAGFSVLHIFLMSLLVFAGAAQFLAASMTLTGASVSAIIIMVFFLNLRHVLMSASISEYVKRRGIGFLTFFGHTLSDESFGINFSHFQKGSWTPEEALTASLSNYGTWVVSTVLGGLIGSQLPINTTIMNYALIAMFLCMMVMQFVSSAHMIAAVVSVSATVILTILLKHNIALVIATLIASFTGYYIENRRGSGGRQHVR
ncbi:MAG: AzlC family ABC transporter permease [Alkalibacterium sp.]|nr:AzlC family ABC transporter permease [Alkalibacterium sp.]